MVNLDELGSFSWALQWTKMAITPSFLGVWGWSLMFWEAWKQGYHFDVASFYSG